MPRPPPVHSLFTDLPWPSAARPNSKLPWPGFPPTSPSLRPDKQIRQARGLRTAAGGGAGLGGLGEARRQRGERQRSPLLC